MNDELKQAQRPKRWETALAVYVVAIAGGFTLLLITALGVLLWEVVS